MQHTKHGNKAWDLDKALNPALLFENIRLWSSGQYMKVYCICSKSCWMLQPNHSNKSSVLPSIHKAYRPNKPSVQDFLWCGNGRSTIALMWPVAPPKFCPPVMPWGEHWKATLKISPHEKGQQLHSTSLWNYVHTNSLAIEAVYTHTYWSL